MKKYYAKKSRNFLRLFLFSKIHISNEEITYFTPYKHPIIC